jgi:hypothetical protein
LLSLILLCVALLEWSQAFWDPVIGKLRSHPPGVESVHVAYRHFAVWLLLAQLCVTWRRTRIVLRCECVLTQLALKSYK